MQLSLSLPCLVSLNIVLYSAFPKHIYDGSEYMIFFTWGIVTGFEFLTDCLADLPIIEQKAVAILCLAADTVKCILMIMTKARAVYAHELGHHSCFQLSFLET